MSFHATRPERLGSYIVRNNATVREAAKFFSVSKSTVHTDVTEKLKGINSGLYAKVREVLDENKRQRHIRGGIATKEKYRKLKNGSD
ncbi:MAG: sporulation transcriptional regulator SpoIIID [Clostridia bacterium]|nr:sporulation transcriptional regulator SpoIIID [Clostridia bacterium]